MRKRKANGFGMSHSCHWVNHEGQHNGVHIPEQTKAYHNVFSDPKLQRLSQKTAMLPLLLAGAAHPRLELRRPRFLFGKISPSFLSSCSIYLVNMATTTQGRTRNRNSLRGNRNRRRAQIHQQISELQNELARLALESADEDEAATPVGPNMDVDAQGRPWVRDDRVRITISGRHYGRVGRLTEPRKDTYWWMVLDPLPGQSRGELIYKKPTSFVHMTSTT